MINILKKQKKDLIVQLCLLIMFALCSCVGNTPSESGRENGGKDDIIKIEIPSSQLSWKLSCTENTINVEVTSNADWSVTVEDNFSSWILVTPTEGSAGKYILDISVSANESNKPRIGKLIVSSGDISREIKIAQKEKIFQPEGGGPEDMPLEEWK